MDRKIIYADELMLAIRDDINISGRSYARIKEHVNEVKAVDAVEVVHGRWIWKDGKCFCSACKEQGEPKFVEPDGCVEEYPYCPNCGADMRN